MEQRIIYMSMDICVHLFLRIDYGVAKYVPDDSRSYNEQVRQKAKCKTPCARTAQNVV